MIITRVSKGTQHEVYNNFVTPPKENVESSDMLQFLPDPNGNFSKVSIKDDFIV
jgi:hypothetical protein